jgi:hypothetical protein
MGCNNCGEKPALWWLSLYRRCFDALRATDNKVVQASWMMAVCMKETGGSGVWIGENGLYKANFFDMAKHTGLNQNDFRQYISIKNNPLRGSVPKFRFEPNWYSLVNKIKEYDSTNKLDKVLLSCSWGIAQKGGLWFVEHMEPIDRVFALKRFICPEGSQLQELVQDLMEIEDHDPGKAGLRFTRYNAGLHVNRINTYGEQVAALANELSHHIKEGGHPECLV